MSSVPAPRTGFKFMLQITSGPDRGATYQLLPPRVTIGRGADNHVVLNDPKSSRNAAVIEFSMEQITIEDVSSRTSLAVNSRPTSTSSIRNGDLITIGETTMLFVVEALQMSPRPNMMRPQNQPGQRIASVQGSMRNSNIAGFPPPPPMGSGSNSASNQSYGSSADKGKVKFYAIVGGVILLFVWLLNSETIQAPKAKALKTVEEREAELKDSELRLEDLAKKRTFANDEEKTRYEEAQRHFLEGFRDHQKGKWQRAIKSFETAQAIDPKHTMAGRYYRLAEKQRDELVSRLSLEGRRYKEKNMYKRCSAAFEKVLDAVANRQDVRFKQAEAFKKECDLLLEERFK